VVRKKKGLSAGAIIGIVIGSISLLLAACIVIIGIQAVTGPPTGDDVQYVDRSIYYGDISGAPIGWTITAKNTSSFKTISLVDLSIPVTHGGVQVGTAYGAASNIPPGSTFKVNLICTGALTIEGLTLDMNNARILVR
jgi:hypothetical protein